MLFLKQVTFGYNGYEAKGLNNANHSLNKLYIALETATYI